MRQTMILSCDFSWCVLAAESPREHTTAQPVLSVGTLEWQIQRSNLARGDLWWPEVTCGGL